jgi:3-dehydroquinate dehydratase I
MKKNKICAVITGHDKSGLDRTGEKADLFEVRIDLIGNAWPEVVTRLNKPWIATNRSAAQHGKWTGSEEARTAELLKAVDLGARMIDIELDTKDLPAFVSRIKGKAKCLISHHDWEGTPPAAELAQIVESEITAGAYTCKVVTTAQKFEDNITVLQLMGMFPAARLIAFAMGNAGVLSRVMAPLAGAYFTYASINATAASAPGPTICMPSASRSLARAR